MPYKKRVYLPNRFYHIVSRGNRRDPLFYSSDDFLVFIQILDQIYQDIQFEIAAYCFMTNHYHLQLRSKEALISKVMALLNKRYANYYNTKYCLTGHVFEKRYYDKLIEDKIGMIEVSKYIHFNPIKAKMAKQPEHYPWSSYKFFKQPYLKQLKFMSIHSILDFYLGTK